MRETLEESRYFLAFQYYINLIRSRFVSYRLELLVISLYTLLTIIFTYPVAFALNEIPGGDDAFFYLWDLWWFKKALLSFTNPYFTTYLFYPDGISLAYSTITPFNGIISIPLQFLFRVSVVYNILWLCTFIIAGFGTYLLVLYLTKNYYAAFVAGLIFAFSPYHFAHALGHLSLMTIQWIPFFVLFFYKSIKEEDDLRNPLLAGFFLVLIGLSDINYLFYSLAFGAIFLAFSFIYFRSSLISRKGFIRLSLFFVTSGIGILVAVYPLLREYFTVQSPYQDFGPMEIYSADVLAFFTPSKLHPVFGKIFESLNSNFTGNTAESTVFIGFTVCFLVVVALLKKRGPDIKFWALACGSFFILSLGPFLHFNGIFYLTLWGIQYKIILPGVIGGLPIISMAHVPARWDVMTMLSVSVIAGFGLDEILKKYQGCQWKKISINRFLSVIFIIFIMFEYLVIPYPMTNVKIPDYYEIFAQDHETYAIYEIPDSVSFLSSPVIMYYQTFHEKHILSGYTHITNSATKFKSTTPLIRDLYFVVQSPENNGGSSKDIFRQDIYEIGKSVLNYYNIRYIVLHEKLLTKDQINYSNALLERAVNKTYLSYPNQSVKIYQVPLEPVEPFMTLGNGFSSLEILNGTRSRWISDNATILIHSGDKRTILMNFNVISSQQTRELHIFSGKLQIGSFSIPAQVTSFSTEVALHEGENDILFHVVADNTSTINDIGKQHPKIALQDIALS